MQTEIVTEGLLLKEDGTLSQKGYAKKLLLRYNRENIKASKLRIKEWDYYCILSDEYGLSLTIADIGYIGFIAATYFDFVNKTEKSNTVITALPLGKMNLPRTSEEGVTKFNNNKIKMEFMTIKNKRVLSFKWDKCFDKTIFEGEITLKKYNEDDTMVIATPFKENKKAFYYNQKINCMPANGWFKFGDRIFEFYGKKDFGVLDWGRGVWPYKNKWYWGSASGLHNGKRFGFNIGYGVGDTSNASENMIFYDGRAHKLDEIVFDIPQSSYLDKWQIVSNDGRFSMNFEPILDRHSHFSILLLEYNQHQVFGRFSGKVVLDNNETLEIIDLFGFAEEVFNKW